MLFCSRNPSKSLILFGGQSRGEGVGGGQSIGTADAAYLALQCSLSWINDLVSNSIFHAKTDAALICPLQH